jgi:hypothetical protein
LGCIAAGKQEAESGSTPQQLIVGSISALELTAHSLSVGNESVSSGCEALDLLMASQMYMLDWDMFLPIRVETITFKEECHLDSLPKYPVHHRRAKHNSVSVSYRISYCSKQMLFTWHRGMFCRSVDGSFLCV